MPNVFDTPDVPKPTDPNQVANSQAALNLKSATGQQNLNQIDQTNPYGSVKYTQTGTNPDGTPKYSANTSLSPQQQALLDQLQSTQSTAGRAAGSVLSANAGKYGSATDFADASSGLTKDLLNKEIGYLTPY